MSTDTSNFLIAEAQLELDHARKQKAKRIKTLGEPLELPGKALAIKVKDNTAWIAENTTVVRKLDLESGKTLQVYKGHAGPVTTLAFCDKEPRSVDNKILITGSWDRSIKLWDTDTKQLISSTSDAHSDFIKTFFVFPSLNLLVSGGSDKIVRFWDLSIPTRSEPLVGVGSISSHTRPVECLDGYATSDASAVLYTADTMGVIKVWNLNKESGANARWRATLKEELNHHRTRINEMLCGNGQLWTASADDTVQILPEEQKEAVPRKSNSIAHPVAVRAILPLSLTDLGEPYLITGAGDVLRVFEVSSLDEPELVSKTDAHWHDITAICLWHRTSLNADGKKQTEPWIITTSLDRTVRKWRLHDLLNPPAPSKDEVQNREPPPASTPNDDGGFALSEEEARELAELLDD